MKKIVLTVFILFYLIPSQALAINAEIPVFNANGQKLPLNPSAYTENDTTMLPLRTVAEYLGAEVSWQPSDQIIITKNDCQIFLNVGQVNAIKKQGEKTETFSLSTAPLYKYDTLFVPLRFIAEALDTSVNYCINYQDDTKYPAIFLGESKYAENYSFERIYKKEINEQLVEEMRNEMLNSNNYSLCEQNNINSIFVSHIIGLYAEYYNLYQPFDEYEKQIYDHLAFYISDEVLTSSEWQHFLALAKHQKSEISATPLKITVDNNKISGTYCFELFDAIFILPLLAEVEITRCDDSLKEQLPTSPVQPHTYYSTDADPETDSNGHIWRVTRINNVRAYINLQALYDNEPEMYERFIATQELI